MSCVSGIKGRRGNSAACRPDRLSLWRWPGLWRGFGLWRRPAHRWRITEGLRSLLSHFTGSHVAIQVARSIGRSVLPAAASRPVHVSVAPGVDVVRPLPGPLHVPGYGSRRCSAGSCSRRWCSSARPPTRQRELQLLGRRRHESSTYRKESPARPTSHKWDSLRWPHRRLRRKSYRCDSEKCPGINGTIWRCRPTRDSRTRKASIGAEITLCISIAYGEAIRWSYFDDGDSAGCPHRAPRSEAGW